MLYMWIYGQYPIASHKQYSVDEEKTGQCSCNKEPTKQTSNTSMSRLSQGYNSWEILGSTKADPILQRIYSQIVTQHRQLLLKKKMEKKITEFNLNQPINDELKKTLETEKKTI